MAPKIINPILYLDICDFLHNEITRHDHNDNSADSSPSARRPSIKKATNILRADEPQSNGQENRYQGEYDSRSSNLGSHNPNLALDPNTLTDGKGYAIEDFRKVSTNFSLNIYGGNNKVKILARD